MSHSDAPSRLTVGNRRNETTRWALRRAIDKPEPVVDTAALAPDSRTELAEDLSMALLLTPDRLSALERAAFLLHDVFDFSFSEVAAALERSEAACRQLAAHVRQARPLGATVTPTRSGEIDAKHAQLMSAFAAAMQSGDRTATTPSSKIDFDLGARPIWKDLDEFESGRLKCHHNASGSRQGMRTPGAITCPCRRAPWAWSARYGCLGQV